MGDIYISKTPGNCPRLIGMSGNKKPFQFLGFLGLRAFCPKNKAQLLQHNWTKQDAIDNLNENDFYLAGNINDKVNKSLDLASKQMNEKWANEKLAAKIEEIKPEPNVPKLDIPDGYKLLGLNDIVPHNAKYLWSKWHIGDWCKVVNSIGKTVKWGKEQWGDDIEYIIPIKD